jgi:hypothetical protein
MLAHRLHRILATKLESDTADIASNATSSQNSVVSRRQPIHTKEPVLPLVGNSRLESEIHICIVPIAKNDHSQSPFVLDLLCTSKDAI